MASIPGFPRAPGRKMGEIDKIERTRIEKAFQWNKQPRTLGFPKQFRIRVCSTPSVPYNHYKPTWLRSCPRGFSSLKIRAICSRNSRRRGPKKEPGSRPLPAAKDLSVGQRLRSLTSSLQTESQGPKESPRTTKGVAAPHRRN
jgi:hypothetical protein